MILNMSARAVDSRWEGELDVLRRHTTYYWGKLIQNLVSSAAAVASAAAATSFCIHCDSKKQGDKGKAS